MFRKTLRVMIISIVCFLPLNVYSSSTKEDYELRERCGKRSEEWFKRNYGDGITKSDFGEERWRYQNHYNKELNKCFIFIVTTSFTRNKDKDKYKDTNYSKKMYLWDVNENKEYGSFSNIEPFIYCSVLGNKSFITCKSEEEWDSLVKSYWEQ